MAAHERGPLAMNQTEALRGTAASEAVLTRVIDAPRARVFDAWTDPARLASWWGPHGVTTAVCRTDPRPGGRYRIVMRAPDGTEYPTKGVYTEVVEPARLTFTADLSAHPPEWHDLLRASLGEPGGEAVPGPELLTTVTFGEEEGRTSLTIRTRFESPALRDAFVKMGMNEGWSQSLEKLEALLARPKGGT